MGTDGEKIVKWQDIENLNKVQEREGLTLANTLNSNHIQWHMHKMNVKLAAQTLSSSVADALDFLRDDLRNPDIACCEGTVFFIRAVDMAFDILQSRSPRVSGCKAPLRKSSMNMSETALVRTANMLLGAKSLKGQKMIYSRRKTVFIGMVVSIKSVISIAKGMFSRPINPPSYILTYRFSQDHIEVLFSCIRAKHGWNNNPKSIQFRSALRNMLFNHSIKASLKANCVQYELAAQTPIFNLQWSKRASPLKDIDTLSNTNENDTYILDLDLPNCLPPYKDNVLYYISGFICRKIKDTISCKDCLLSIMDTAPTSVDDLGPSSIIYGRNLTKRKDRGGLINASQGIFEILKVCEKVFTLHILYTKYKTLSLKLEFAKK